MDTPQEKTCSKCHVSKLLDEFHNDPSGKYGKGARCKACKQCRDATLIDMPKVVPEEKVCCGCEIVKPIDQFGLDKYTSDGHATRCKTCDMILHALDCLKFCITEERDDESDEA